MRSDVSAAHAAARAIANAYANYSARFLQITKRAASRFLSRDWHRMQEDAGERLDVYLRMMFRSVADMRLLLGERIRDRSLWALIKSLYAGEMAQHPGRELAESFFNSIVRRIFTTVGVDPNIEFVDGPALIPHGYGEAGEPGGPPIGADRGITRIFSTEGGTEDWVRRVLLSYPTQGHHQNIDVDARLAAERIEEQWARQSPKRALRAVEMVQPIFYRGQAAYLVGRILVEGGSVAPLIIVLRNDRQGIYADAVLTSVDEASIVFSFTRSYFHVETSDPRGLVGFLHLIMPKKRTAELYTAIGYNRHGKTELYRDLRRHLDASEDLLEIAAGDRGMVMIVFTLRSYDVVFKVIRDEFLPPKSITRREVMAKYDFVFKHDRAGRLIEAAEFEHLGFDRSRLSPELLEELLASAASSVSMEGNNLAIAHLYIERRVKPLNLYLRSAPPEAARTAVLDYGRAIKDLARTNIFTGDLLPKNFGVTRHGRVVFYDYDELCMLSDCNFRDMPAPQDEIDEMRGEPSFYVGPNDMFPEEFIRFLGLPEDLREVFVQEHGDLLNPRFWRSMQNRIREGELIDIFPYPPEKRLRHHG